VHNKRRDFIGGLLALPFAGKAAAAAVTQAPPSFDVQAAKRAWREYVGQCEKVAEAALWQGKDLQAAMAEVEEFKRLNPPPPHAKPKDRFAALERIAATARA
jgi:hypothetical protein